MRARPAYVAVSLVLVSGLAHASGTFTALQTSGLTLGKVSANGAYAVGSTFGGQGFRWTTSTATEEILPDLDTALGVNNLGTVSGAVPENGGVNNGGRDLGAFQPVGTDPVAADLAAADELERLRRRRRRHRRRPFVRRQLRRARGRIRHGPKPKA